MNATERERTKRHDKVGKTSGETVPSLSQAPSGFASFLVVTISNYTGVLL